MVDHGDQSHFTHCLVDMQRIGAEPPGCVGSLTWQVILDRHGQVYDDAVYLPPGTTVAQVCVQQVSADGCSPHKGLSSLALRC
jgi:hypothetical protein